MAESPSAPGLTKPSACNRMNTPATTTEPRSFADSLADIRLLQQRVATDALRDGRVLVIGAENSRRVFPPETAEAYNPKTGKFDEDVPNPACDVCTATALHSGWLLVAGGNDESGDPVASAQLANASSYDVKPTGSMTYPRADATATVLQDGRVLIVGGHGEASILASAELYQP